MDYTLLLSTQEDKISEQEDHLQTLYKQYLEELENKLFPAKQQLVDLKHIYNDTITKMVNDMTMSEYPYTVYLLLKEDTGILKTATVYVGPIPKIYEKFSNVKIYSLHMETRLQLDNKEYDIETIDHKALDWVYDRFRNNKTQAPTSLRYDIKITYIL